MKKIKEQKIKKEIIKELENLNPNALLMVYELILSFKGRKAKQRSKPNLPTYRKVRNALKGCSRSLSEDIFSAREERV